MGPTAERELLYAVGHNFYYGTPGPGPVLMPYKRPEWAARAEWGGFERNRAIEAMRYFDGVLSKQPYVTEASFRGRISQCGQVCTLPESLSGESRTT